MNATVVKIIAVIPGLPLLMNAILFVVDPAKVTADLGMPLLDGLGRSTQLADLGALFLFGAILDFLWCFQIRRFVSSHRRLLLGLIAVLRVVAWGVNGAELATMLIITKLVLVIWLLVGGGIPRQVETGRWSRVSEVSAMDFGANNFGARCADIPEASGARSPLRKRPLTRLTASMSLYQFKTCPFLCQSTARAQAAFA